MVTALYDVKHFSLRDKSVLWMKGYHGQWPIHHQVIKGDALDLCCCCVDADVLFSKESSNQPARPGTNQPDDSDAMLTPLPPDS